MADDGEISSLDEELREKLRDRIAKTIAIDIGVCSKYSDYNCTRRPTSAKEDSHRKGPIPIEDFVLGKATQVATYGTLDSDCDDLDFEEIREHNATSTDYNKIRMTTNDEGNSIASCRALIMYMSGLAKAKDEQESVDLNFLQSLLDSGADINFPDKHGQTMLHEASRGWHPDLVKFALENGAEINKADLLGRTPLHLAAAVDYGEMVEYLIENGADLGRETFEEKQTAMHYAAKNNASQSLKVMLRMGARMNDRDYKRRTPLFVAAETAREDSALFLIEQGAPCGVYDISGTPLLTLIVENIPQIATEAVEQFHLLDLAFRKHYYYLAYLEKDPSFLMDKYPESKRGQKELIAKKKAEKRLAKDQGLPPPPKKPKTYAKTPLEVIVEYNQLDLIMHPVFQRLLHVKWELFGKRAVMKLVILNLFYTLIWTVLGICIPREGESFYSPMSKNWWRVVLELIGVLLTVYFLVSEILLVKSAERSHFAWTQWKTKHLEKDLKFCHPRWPEEEKYLRSELEEIHEYQRTYFRDAWNIIEWVAYVVVLTLVFTRILAVAMNNETANKIHPRVYAIGLIVIWIRFMRSVRSFQSVGPFIVILSSVIKDTIKFTFLFFEFYIPYTVAFWILFGGKENAAKMDKDAYNSWDWMKFHDLTFSMWSMSLNGGFNWDGLVAVDRLMAQILCGTYLALCAVICMNIYIALLSDTFAREYEQAQANAMMEKAKSILLCESKLDKIGRSFCGYYMQENCAPQVVNTSEENNDVGGNDEEEKMNKLIRQVNNRIDEVDDALLLDEDSRDMMDMYPQPADCSSGIVGIGKDWSDFVEKQRVFNSQVKSQIDEIKNLSDDVMSLLKVKLQPSSAVRRRRKSSSRGKAPVEEHPIKRSSDAFLDSNALGTGNRLPVNDISDSASPVVSAVYPDIASAINYTDKPSSSGLDLEMDPVQSVVVFDPSRSAPIIAYDDDDDLLESNI